jgi:hypothetical protein
MEDRLRSGALFDEVVEAWRRLGRLVYDDTAVGPDSLERATGLAYLTRYLTAGATLAMELADPDYPYFDRWADRAYTWGVDSPDGIYSFAAVRGDAVYRIHGDRGTAHQFDLEVHSPHFANAPRYRRTGNLRFTDIVTDADGSVEITLSPEPAPDGAANWVQLDEHAGSVCIRQFFADWETERKASLVIERVGATYPPPPESPDAVVDRAELLIRWMDQAGTFWDDALRAFATEPNTITFVPPAESDWGGHGGLAYGFGMLEIGPDEAAIIEVTPPDCHLWSFQLASIYWESMDWWRRQSSLNHHQAVLDDDGVFRAVVAHRDPGVHNWLDAAGFSQVTVMGRWLHATEFPRPEVTVIPVDDVVDHLPASTLLVGPAERSETIRRRQAAAQRLLGL